MTQNIFVIATATLNTLRLKHASEYITSERNSIWPT